METSTLGEDEQAFARTLRRALLSNTSIRHLDLDLLGESDMDVSEEIHETTTAKYILDLYEVLFAPSDCCVLDYFSFEPPDMQRLPEYPENVPSENQVPCQVRRL
jgi:hypothetical protein